jgi:hypothetical protein
MGLEESPRYEGAPGPGTGGTPYRVATERVYFPVTSAELNPDTDWLDRSNELRSIEGSVANIVDLIHPTARLAERAYFNNLTWLLSLAGFVGVHTSGDGIITDPDGTVIATGAHRWVFSKRTGAAAQTAQLRACYGTAGPWLQGQGFGVSQLNLNGVGELDATLEGLVLSRLASDPLLTPTYDVSAILPARRADLILTWLGSSALTSDFSLSLSNPLFAYSSYSLATPSLYRDKMEQGDDRARLTGTVTKRTIANADWDALQQATTWSAVAKWKSQKSIGATATKYGLFVQMPGCQYSSGNPDALGNRRRFGSSYDFWAAYDETAGYDVKFTLVNAVATIATYP